MGRWTSLPIFADSSLAHAQKIIQVYTRNNIDDLGGVKYWRMQFNSPNSPNSPKFSSARILRYTVLDGEGECFSDWKEQFELVAGACYWTDQSKLVNLVTRLRGQAYSYYRSCTPEQRSSYPLLVKALEDRFTPVRIQVVQSSRFHERNSLPQRVSTAMHKI